MKSAHQEEAADKTEDHTGTKQIWTEAVSTCDLKRRFEQQASTRTTKQLCTICSHLSHLEHDRQRARVWFIFSLSPSLTGFKWNLIFSLKSFSINQLMGGDAFPGSHTV